MPEATRELQERYDKRGRRLLTILLGLGALMLLIAVVTAARTMISIAHDTDMVEHTQEVQATINQLNALAERIETARRGYIIQQDASFAGNVRQASASFDGTLSVLGTLISDNPAQIDRVDRIEDLAREKGVLLDSMFAAPDETREAIRTSDFDAERGVAITREIRDLLNEMSDAEKVLLTQRNRNQLDSLVTFYITGGLALALLVAVMIAAILVVSRYNRDLTKAEKRLLAVNEGLEEAVGQRTAELTRANAEIQRFAYIVSHDLRSPLVNVLGFTAELDAARKTLHGYLTRLYEDHPELKDQDAWLAVEEDLPEALDFIRTSTEKMDRLINSILELSRQGRRTLNPELLDMTALSETVASTMKQRADEAGATVTVSTIPPIESDRIAVEQILSNLIENALKYLSPRRAGVVQVEGRRQNGHVEIAVIDNGRGIAPEDHERIFDLFRRAGTQDKPGEGLGLANVRALAYRLGGTIDVESQLDEGSRFVLILPERFVAAEPA